MIAIPYIDWGIPCNILFLFSMIVYNKGCYGDSVSMVAKYRIVLSIMLYVLLCENLTKSVFYLTSYKVKENAKLKIRMKRNFLTRGSRR